MTVLIFAYSCGRGKLPNLSYPLVQEGLSSLRELLQTEQNALSQLRPPRLDLACTKVFFEDGAEEYPALSVRGDWRD